MASDQEIRVRQKARNRIVLVLLLLFAAIIFALTFQHMLSEQKLPKPQVVVFDDSDRGLVERFDG